MILVRGWEEALARSVAAPRFVQQSSLSRLKRFIQDLSTLHFLFILLERNHEFETVFFKLRAQNGVLLVHFLNPTLEQIDIIWIKLQV